VANNPPKTRSPKRPASVPPDARWVPDDKEWEQGTIDGKAMQAMLRRQGGQTPGWDLTPREKEVLPLLVKGLTNDEIAERLILSTATVRLHVSNVLMKLHASNRTTAAVIAVENRLV